MRFKFIVHLIIFIPTLGFSQINSSIDLMGGIDYSYRHLTTSSADNMGVLILENRNNKEFGKLNWRTGLNYNQRLKKRIFLKTGLRLASVGYKGENRTGLKWSSEYDGMGGWIPDPSLPHEIQLVYDYWFVELPIVGRMEFGTKKLTPFVELGVSPAVYLTTRTKTITDIGANSEFQNSGAPNFNKIHFVGVFSFGANYSVNENVQIFGQPTFRYHLTKLVNAPIGEYLYNYGIEIGIRRKIK